MPEQTRSLDPAQCDLTVYLLAPERVQTLSNLISLGQESRWIYHLNKPNKDAFKLMQSVEVQWSTFSIVSSVNYFLELLGWWEPMIGPVYPMSAPFTRRFITAWRGMGSV